MLSCPPSDPVEPLAPPPWLDDDDGEEGDEEPELPLDGDPDGVCELEPPLDDDGDDGLDDDEPPDDGDGMPLGIELDVVVLQPASVSATATASSVDKPWERCMM